MPCGDHRRVIVPAAGAEGDEIGPQAGEDDLGGKDDDEGAEGARQLGHINGHHGHAKKDLKAQIAERVQFLGPDLHMDGVQNVADDDAADHAADEVGKFDIGDPAGQDGDVGAQSGGYDDETYAAQQGLPIQRDDGLGLRLGHPRLSVQMVALDQRPGHRSAAQAGKHHTKGGAHNGQYDGVFRAQRLIGGGDGAGGAHAAHQRQGAQSQAVEGVHPQQHSQDYAQNVLTQDQSDGGNGDPDAHLSTLFN